MAKTWFPVPGYPFLEVTSEGQVKNTSMRGTCILSQHENQRGYYEVWPRQYDGRYRFRVHTLVLSAFCGERPKGKVCRHLDGNPLNNHKDNLVWGTMSENNEDKRRHGVDNSGERCGNSKLKEKDVRMIIYQFATGLFTQTELAKGCRVVPCTVNDILHKRTWRHIWRKF